MAARPAIDSLMPCIRGASWGPVNSHCPIRRGPVSGIHGNRSNGRTRPTASFARRLR